MVVPLVVAAIAGGAKLNDVGDFQSYSVLLMSLENKDSRVLAALLKAGADPNWKGLPGHPLLTTPLNMAATKRDSAYFKLLLAAGAKVDALDAGAFNALDYAAKGSNLEIAKILIQAGMKAAPRPTPPVATPAVPEDIDPRDREQLPGWGKLKPSEKEKPSATS